MKRRRGIDLAPARDQIAYLGPLSDQHVTFSDLPSFQALGGHCTRCEREAWVDRWALERKWGGGTYLSSLAGRLRCLECGNKGNNKWILGQLPR